ncbi:MAG TPA: ERF family protein [Verrucomicrobiae bacterium]|nr:ERF family protein [Verrucomicrobiae bacterium]
MPTKTIEAEQTDLGIDTPIAQDVAVRHEGAIETANQGEIVRSAILELARDPSFDVAKLQALTAMQERAEDRQALRAFAVDMAAAQSECQAVVRNAEVKLGKEGENKGGYRYAALEDIDEMIRPIMTKYGFSVTYDRAPRQGDGGGFVVTGTLWHRGGHNITASFPLPLDSGPGRGNLQAAGSTDTYGQKYILIGFFRIVRKGADDDGVAAGGLPITFDEAAQIKIMVEEAGLGEGLGPDERKTIIVEWFNDMLGYALPKGYISIRQEDNVRVRRALLSLKAKHLTSIEQKVKL